jgi:hypothetical protein
MAFGVLTGPFFSTWNVTGTGWVECVWSAAPDSWEKAGSAAAAARANAANGGKAFMVGERFPARPPPVEVRRGEPPASTGTRWFRCSACLSLFDDVPAR